MSRRYGMTNAEANASAAKFRETCPKCKSQRTYVAGFSFGMYHGCHECNRKWGWCNAAGTEVSRQKFEERAEKDHEEWRTKSAKSWRMDAPAGKETDMAKKLAKKSGAKGAKAKSKKKAASKKTDGKRDSRIPKVGTVLKAKYKGKDYTAKVTATGFEFAGKQYGSISKVGSVIMAGKACNGYKLFGLC